MLAMRYVLDIVSIFFWIYQCRGGAVYLFLTVTQAISKDSAEIGGGAAMAIVGGLTIAVGLLAEIPTAGASTAVVVAGIAVVAGGAVLIGMSSLYHLFSVLSHFFGKDLSEMLLLNGALNSTCS